MNMTMDLKFSDIKEPRLLCLIFAKGGATKLFQSYLDAHPEIYNIPAFPLLYLYPHWPIWQEQYQEVWNWDTIINILCIQHASLIDSRKLVGLNGLNVLGEGQDESITIDAEVFRGYLKSLLRDQPISRRTFLLAVNYAYALCKGDDISNKKVLLWHHHDIAYLEDFMSDFPAAIIVGMIRDTRIKIYSCCAQDIKSDEIKLNPTDAMINRSYVFYQNNRLLFMFPYKLFKIDAPGRIFFLKHEDLASDLPRVMHKIADLIGVQFHDSMLESTFDGKVWWGHEIYTMPDVTQDGAGKERAKKVSQEALKRVLSTSWQKQKPWWEIFVFEGLDYDYLNEYGYVPLYYKKDSWWERMLMLMAIWIPIKMEIQDTLFYLNPCTHAKIIKTAWQEATGKIRRKYYGFSATYLFKHSYKAFAYWKRPFIVHWLDQAEKSKDKNIVKHKIFMSAVIAYVVYVYIKFLAAIAFLPFQYCRRIGMYYFVFIRRLLHGNLLAPQI